MQRSFLIFGIAFVSLMAGALFYAARMPVERSPQPETQAPAPDASESGIFPAFTLADLEGGQHELSEWDGSYRLLNFWATWCAPCRREIPLLKRFQDEHGANGFQVIGIAVDFADAVSAYAADANFNYPVLVGQEDAMAVAETSGIEFIGLPFTMIVGADGQLLSSHIGEIFEDDLAHIVEVINLLDAGEIDRDGAREALYAL